MLTTTTTTPPLAVPALSATSPAPSPAPSTVVASDYETFLLMLTTELQNQDPTDPIDASDFALQLATFSGVEQQVLTNDLLAGLSSQFDIIGISQLGSWVGQEARTAAPVWMDGDPVTLAYAPDPLADQAVLVVKDSLGNVVAREDVPLSDDPYLWLGGDATGNPLPEGVYSLSLESYSGDTLLASGVVESYALIEEARNGTDGVTLILEGGIEVPATAITALRAA